MQSAPLLPPASPHGHQAAHSSGQSAPCDHAGSSATARHAGAVHAWQNGFRRQRYPWACSIPQPPASPPLRCAGQLAASAGFVLLLLQPLHALHELGRHDQAAFLSHQVDPDHARHAQVAQAQPARCAQHAGEGRRPGASHHRRAPHPDLPCRSCRNRLADVQPARAATAGSTRGPGRPPLSLTCTQHPPAAQCPRCAAPARRGADPAWPRGPRTGPWETPCGTRAGERA